MIEVELGKNGIANFRHFKFVLVDLDSRHLRSPRAWN